MNEKNDATPSTIKLPAPEKEGGTGLWGAVSRRRSVRRYTNRALSLSELSQLLWASQGITGGAGRLGLRAAPSAGATFPLETYAAANRVEGLACGIYRYLPGEHALILHRPGECGTALAAAALGQRMLAEAPAVIIWSAVFGRTASRYGQRAVRYVYLEAGHAAQNLALAAVALGLATCQVGAYSDDEVNRIAGVDGREESVIYMSVVGQEA